MKAISLSDCSAGKAFTVLELLLAIAVLAVLIILGMSSFQSVRQSSQAIGCISNLRALHVMMNQYANDHQNRYPFGYKSPSTWTSQTAAYRPVSGSVKEGITYCPATSVSGEGVYERDRSTWRTDYNINRFVCTSEERGNYRPSIPPHLIFLFDGNGGVSGSASTSKEALRHRGRFNVLFVDGHIETASSITDYDSNWKR